MRKEVKKICAHCGKEFIGNAKNQYCSNACKQAAYRKRNNIVTTS